MTQGVVDLVLAAACLVLAIVPWRAGARRPRSVLLTCRDSRSHWLLHPGEDPANG
jgi:hypothetical protein